MKKRKTLIFALAFTQTIVFSSTIALAKSYTGSYEGYEYVQVLASRKVSSQTNTYYGFAQTKWSKPQSRVMAYIEGVNSSGGLIGGSNAQAYGYNGYVSVDTPYVNNPGLKYWNSSHKLYDNSGNILTGSTMWHQIDR